MSRQSNEWYTPWYVIHALEDEYGAFDLDPCCTDESAKAPEYYTKEQDGLTQHWWGKVFLNPPYTTGQPQKWIDKAISELPNVELIVALTHSSTDTKWWQKAYSYADEVRFPAGRIKFIREGKQSTGKYGSTIFIFKGHNG